MRVLGVVWLGVWTDRFEETASFFARVLGVPGDPPTGPIAVLRAGGGDEVELFAAGTDYFDFYRRESRGPVPGFRVENLDDALAQARSTGAELVAEPDAHGDHRWVHVRAPDGNLYELVEMPGVETTGRGITWLGTRTAAFEETIDFARGVLGLELREREARMAKLVAQDGDQFEVFTEDEPDHRFMTTGPVAGFHVDDLRVATEAVRAAGAEVLAPPGSAGTSAWQHVRGPDGRVYELLADA